MNGVLFDAIGKRLAQRYLSRHRAMVQGGTGLAAGALANAGLTVATSAQDATPEPASGAGDHGPTMLFLQTCK